MAGFAPFGRDDQPLLDVKIVGGRRVEIAVDQYGRPLKRTINRSKPDNEPRLSNERIDPNSKSSSVPPWISGETPPKKTLKPLQISPVGTAKSSRSSSRSFSSRICSDSDINRGNNKDSSELLQELKPRLHGLDTAKLKDTYLHFTGLDSTLTGFVDGSQVEQVFRKCGIPITGQHLDALKSKFMSARRPDWINYEQMLKYVNGIVRNEGAGVNPSGPYLQQWTPTGEQEISLKPNHISPDQRIYEESMCGRQSTMLVKHVFRDRQDAHLLIEMERLLKQVKNIKGLIWNLKETLNDCDQNNSKILSSQKLKSVCLRHHLPFNGSLLDKILDRFDPRGSGKVNWTEFMAFVERAMPLASPSSQACSYSSVETPPSQPSWETQQPLQALTKQQQGIPRAAAFEQEEMYDAQKRILDKQLKEHSQQLSKVLNKQQQDLDKSEETFQTDHIPDYKHMWSIDKEELPHLSEYDEQRHTKLLQKQFEFIEQKRKINQEQEELEKLVKNGAGVSTEKTKGSHVNSFLRLANALFLYDSSGSGFLEEDVIRRLVTNYNLVYGLDFSFDVTEDAIDSSSTDNGLVSVDRLLDELKKHL